MSRYHSVRPKHQQVPTPAAPAQSKSGMPPAALIEKVAREKIQLAADEIYKSRNGGELDASIARWKKLLAIHDRELDIVAASDGTKPHRWTISPSIAFRVDKLLRELLEEQTQLKAECAALAKQIAADIINGRVNNASLCPPKWAESAPDKGSAANTKSQPTAKPAQAPPTALNPAA